MCDHQFRDDCETCHYCAVVGRLDSEGVLKQTSWAPGLVQALVDKSLSGVLKAMGDDGSSWAPIQEAKKFLARN